MKLPSTVLLAGILTAGMTPLLSQAQSYTITDLGTVSGESTSSGYALNESGQAAGASSNPNGDIATMFSGSKAIDLGTLEPLDVSVATSINGSGEVAGFEPFSSTSTDTDHAWVYSNGALIDINSSSLFPSGTEAEGINDSGVVVGQGWLNSSSFHAFVYAEGKMVDIGPPGSYQASAIAINDNGQILGNAYFTSGGGGVFIYANAKFTYLTTPTGATASGIALNSLGQVLGELFTSSGTDLAVYSNGKWTDLGGSVTGASLRGTGINAAGKVIATAIFPGTYHPFKAGKHVAYVFGSSGPVNLNTLIPANSGYTLTDAIAINDNGQILCDAATPTGAEHAVLLTP
jgi:probable HAF family extracellular repeat protein